MPVAGFPFSPPAAPAAIVRWATQIERYATSLRRGDKAYPLGKELRRHAADVVSGCRIAADRGCDVDVNTAFSIATLRALRLEACVLELLPRLRSDNLPGRPAKTAVLRLVQQHPAWSAERINQALPEERRYDNKRTIQSLVSRARKALGLPRRSRSGEA